MDHKLTHRFYLTDDTLHVSPTLTGNEPNPLELSIQKWETIVTLLERGSYVSLCGGRRTCALCFHYRRNSCVSCPISDAGHAYCDRTPYDDFEEASNIAEKLITARAEVEFLKSLREET